MDIPALKTQEVAGPLARAADGVVPRDGLAQSAAATAAICTTAAALVPGSVSVQHGRACAVGWLAHRQPYSRRLDHRRETHWLVFLVSYGIGGLHPISHGSGAVAVKIVEVLLGIALVVLSARQWKRQHLPGAVCSIRAGGTPFEVLATELSSRSEAQRLRSAVNRPDSTASRRAAWSRSFWSAYADANRVTALSKMFELPR